MAPLMRCGDCGGLLDNRGNCTEHPFDPSAPAEDRQRNSYIQTRAALHGHSVFGSNGSCQYCAGAEALDDPQEQVDERLRTEQKLRAIRQGAQR